MKLEDLLKHNILMTTNPTEFVKSVKMILNPADPKTQAAGCELLEQLIKDAIKKIYTVDNLNKIL